MRARRGAGRPLEPEARIDDARIRANAKQHAGAWRIEISVHWPVGLHNVHFQLVGALAAREAEALQVEQKTQRVGLAGKFGGGQVGLEPKLAFGFGRVDANVYIRFFVKICGNF